MFSGTDRQVLSLLETIHFHSCVLGNILSLTVFCCLIFSSSPSKIVLNESPTLATTPSQACSNFESSSACDTRASRVPILNSGILKGVSTPLSVVIALRSEVNASSLSPVLDIDEGRERSRYVVFSGAMMKGREVRRRGVKRVGLFVQQAGFDNVDVALHVARQITWKVQGPGALSIRNNHVTGLEISTTRFRYNLIHWQCDMHYYFRSLMPSL